MGNQISNQLQNTPAFEQTKSPYPKGKSPARSPLSPSRKRQEGVEISPSSSPARFLQGPVLQADSADNDYVVLDGTDIGEGSFAVVRMGKRISTGDNIAVKIIAKRSVPLEMKHLIEHECTMLRLLDHKVDIF